MTPTLPKNLQKFLTNISHMWTYFCYLESNSFDLLIPDAMAACICEVLDWFTKKA